MIELDHTQLTKRVTEGWVASLKSEPTPTKFRASGIADCLRKAGYAMLSVPPDRLVDKLDYRLAASQGDAIHAGIQAAMVAAGMVLQLPTGPAVEINLRDYGTLDLPDYLFSGRLDVVLQQPDGELAILDIKTVGPRDFEPNNRYWPGKLAHYADQVQMYLRFFQAPDGRSVRRAFVYVVNRGDTTQRRLYRVPYDENTVAALLARLVRATAAYQVGALPDAEPGRGPCNLCPWEPTCTRERATVVEEIPL